MMEGSKISVAA